MTQVISTNRTTVEFWQHKLNCTDIFKSASVEVAKQLSDNTSKDIFLLDNYFTDTPGNNWMVSQLSKIDKIIGPSIVYCISPKFSYTIKSKFKSLIVFNSQLSREVIDGLKAHINQSKINLKSTNYGRIY